jgi:hypothetical protein
MTEAEWLACDDPLRMLAFAHAQAGERKLRLFACACARIDWRHLRPPHHHAIDTAERVAEGRAAPSALATHRALSLGVASGSGRTAAERAIERLIGAIFDRKGGYISVSAYETRWAEARAEVYPVACSLARCILFPFRTAARTPAWRTADAVAVAEGAYADRTAPDGHLTSLRLSILADALEEAGCTDAAILSHLRSPGPHARGCWAVDLILGKS